MALTWRQYRPDYHSVESLSGFMNKILVATPFVLVTGLGLRARENKPEFTFVACTQEQNKVISAYVPIVQKTQAAYRGNPDLSIVVSRQLAQQWMEQYQKGILKPLPSVDAEDTTRDGVKGEIVRANSEVSEALSVGAEDELLKGDRKSAARDALTSLKNLNIVKWSDFSSVAMDTMLQRRSIEILKASISSLSPEEKASVKHDLTELQSSSYNLTRLTEIAKARLIREVWEQGASQQDVDVLDKSFDMFKSQKPVGFLQVCRAITKLSPAYMTTSSDALGEVRLGYISAMDTNEKIKEILN